MASLSPTDDVLLREFYSTPASATVTAEGFDSVSDWSYEASPELPDDVEITPAGETWTLSWDYVAGLFPMIGITYRHDDELSEVVEWDEVPEAAEEIIRMEANPANKREYSVTITATGTAAGQPASASRTYTVQVLHQYDHNQQTLKEEVDARRSA